MSNPKMNKRKKNRNSSKYQKKIDRKIQERRKSALEDTRTEKLSRKKPGTISVGYVIFILAILGVAAGFIIYHTIQTTPETPTTPTQTTTNSVTTQQTTASTYGFPYSVTSISGTKYNFANFQGKIVILNFMSVECQYCGPNTDNLVQTYNSLNSSNVVIFELDVGGDSVADLQQYQQEHSIPYILCQDTGLSIASHFTITGTPTTIILDRNGHQYNSLVGLQTVNALTSAIQEALNS